MRGEFDAEAALAASMRSTSFSGEGKRQVFAGDTVIYHSDQGDVEAILLRFQGFGADLSYADRWHYDVREGPDEGQWDAIPPRRSEPEVG